MDIDYFEIGRRIRTARNHRHMTADQLSEQVGLASESLRHIENGSSNPSLHTLFRIAHILNVSLDYLTARTPALSEGLSSDYGITDAQQLVLKEILDQITPIITKHI